MQPWNGVGNEAASGSAMTATIHAIALDFRLFFAVSPQLSWWPRCEVASVRSIMSPGDIEFVSDLERYFRYFQFLFFLRRKGVGPLIGLI